MSLNHKFRLLCLKSFHLAPQYSIAIPELVLVRLEPQSEEAQAELKELMVVRPVKYGILDVAHQVLEE